MAEVIQVNFRARPEAEQERVLQQEQEIVDRLERLVAVLKARAAGPDCPPGVGWRKRR